MLMFVLVDILSISFRMYDPTSPNVFAPFVGFYGDSTDFIDYYWTQTVILWNINDFFPLYETACVFDTDFREYLCEV